MTTLIPNFVKSGQELGTLAEELKCLYAGTHRQCADASNLIDFLKK
jgi:hypothetical protein